MNMRREVIHQHSLIDVTQVRPQQITQQLFSIDLPVLASVLCI